MFDDDEGLYVDEAHERQAEAERSARAIGGLLAMAVMLVFLLALALVEAWTTS